MPMSAEQVVSVHDVSVQLGGRPVLRGIDLTVHAGEVVTVLGANGSGKSTLVRAVLGLVPTSRGEIRLFGTDRARFRDWQRVGFVPQRATAGAGVPATVTEVVAAGRLARRRPFLPLGKADRAAVRAAIDAVGLTEKAADGVATLSGGQQQRALIARALAGEPDLLVLDEPTAGVDLESQQVFADALRGLVEPWRDRGPGRPRARPDGGPRRPGGRDAGGPGGVRRPSARLLHRGRPRRPPPPRPGPAGRPVLPRRHLAAGRPRPRR